MLGTEYDMGCWVTLIIKKAQVTEAFFKLNTLLFVIELLI